MTLLARATVIATILALPAPLLLPSPALAQAETYPSKPIRMVVGFTAGGTTDIIARVIGPKLTEAWGQPVVIDNRPGAGGNLGGDIVAKAAPDGYTILMGSVGPLAINATLFNKMPYDNLKDFAPITLVAAVANFLVVHPSIPATTVMELVALAKAKPGQLNFASTGNGTSAHLSGELLKQMAGIEMTHVPYRGAVAVNDLLAGQVQLMFATVPSVIQHVKAGSLRGIAMSSSMRISAMPEVPTVAEAGFPGFEASSWFGLVAPAGTPPAIIAKINAQVVKTLREPEIKALMSGQGAEPVGNTPAEFAAYMKAETEKWAPVVKTSGARVD
jgi:tripartite-type tricarboxylate transporter receptor subunit TctC